PTTVIVNQKASWWPSLIQSILHRNTSRKSSEPAIAPSHILPDRSRGVIPWIVLSAPRAQSRCLRFPSAAPARVQQHTGLIVGRLRRTDSPPPLPLDAV